MLYIRNDLIVDPSIITPSILDANIEILNVVLRRQWQKSVCVSITYIPPTSKIALAIEHLDVLSEKITSLGLDWVMGGGDFNINLLVAGNQARKKSINNFINRNSLAQIINTATRITTDTRSLIDHIYVNTPEKINSAGTLAYALSDHLATYIIIKKNLPKKERTSFWCRNTKQYNRNIIRTILDSEDWREFYIEDDSERKWTIMLDLFTNALINWQLEFRDSLLLYKSGILTFFDQGDIFYHAASKDQLQGLQTLQNKCLKKIFMKKDWPGTENTHKRCNLLYVADKRKLSLVKFAHIISYRPENMREERRQNMRSNTVLLLKENHVRYEKYGKSFINISSQLWNRLPQVLKVINNTQVFKTRVKSELLQGKLNFPE